MHRFDTYCRLHADEDHQIRKSLGDLNMDCLLPACLTYDASFWFQCKAECAYAMQGSKLGDDVSPESSARISVSPSRDHGKATGTCLLFERFFFPAAVPGCSLF